MFSKKKTNIPIILSTVLCSLAINLSADNAVKSSFIILNGEKTSVFFNDGDTFKVLSGKNLGQRVRIAGFNTLENYGPVHAWGKNSARYLFEVANLATETARSKSWHCTTMTEKDIYGRLLAQCDDLAIKLIKKGLAHAYTVDDSEALGPYIKAQKRAQKNKLGMWQGGVPKYIITSLHSADESEESHYNRMISSLDGHSKMWSHQEEYTSCQSVCLKDENSCMVYVPYTTRYGAGRPRCLL